jgi:protoporphyrinogen/coproporphyrinogen III oxidase
VTSVAVIGGGITGLAAAYELVRSSPGTEVSLLEAGDRLGGKLLTTLFAGRPVDAGADAFLARHPSGVELCRELGLTDRLVAPAVQSAKVLVDGDLIDLPAETLLGVPTDLDAGVGGDGRPLATEADATVGAVIRERLGDEVLDRFVGPLIGGINAGDPDRLSIRATAPQLAEAAAYPNIVEGARAVRAATAGGDGGPVFLAPRDGMGALVDALANTVVAGGVDVRFGEPAVGLTPAGAGWAVTTPTGTVVANEVLITVPTYAAADLLTDVAADAARDLSAIEYASVVIVTLAFPRSAVPRPLDASGFLVARSEGLLMTACSWASSKWAHLGGTDDPIVLRVSAGRYGDERALDLDDADLVARLVGELAATMSVAGDPSEVRVTRWPRSFPQYAVGHLERVARIEAALPPGLVIAGAGMRGLGVPACILQGRQAAARASATRRSTQSQPAPRRGAPDPRRA